MKVSHILGYFIFRYFFKLIYINNIRTLVYWEKKKIGEKKKIRIILWALFYGSRINNNNSRTFHIIFNVPFWLKVLELLLFILVRLSLLLTSGYYCGGIF